VAWITVRSLNLENPAPIDDLKPKKNRRKTIINKLKSEIFSYN
jgi:hypothetical protein